MSRASGRCNWVIARWLMRHANKQIELRAADVRCDALGQRMRASSSGELPSLGNPPANGAVAEVDNAFVCKTVCADWRPFPAMAIAPRVACCDGLHAVQPGTLPVVTLNRRITGNERFFRVAPTLTFDVGWRCARLCRVKRACTENRLRSLDLGR